MKKINDPYAELNRNAFHACVMALCGNSSLKAQITKVNNSLTEVLDAAIEKKDNTLIKRIKYAFGALVIILTTEDPEEINSYLSPDNLSDIGIGGK